MSGVDKTKIPEIVTSNAVPKSGWRATIRKQAKMKRIAINVSLKLIGSFLFKRQLDKNNGKASFRSSEG